MSFDGGRPIERVAGGSRPSAEELRRRVAGLRRYRRLIRVLALPGIRGVVAHRLQTTKPVVRWLAGAGFDRLTAALDETAGHPPATKSDWRRVLEDAWPPPPPEFWELFDRMTDERPGDRSNLS